MPQEHYQTYLLMMKRKTENRDCNWLYDKYVKPLIKSTDTLHKIKHEDDKICYFFIKKKLE